MAKFLKIMLILFLSIICVFYFSYLYVLPKVINSKKNLVKIENIINKYSDFDIKLKGINLKTKFNFKSVLFIEQADIINKKDFSLYKIINGNLTYQFLTLKEIKADYIKINLKDNKKSNSKPNLKNLPLISIKKLEINKAKTNFIIEEFSAYYKENIYNTSFIAKITSYYLIKKIEIKNKNNLFIKDSKLYAQNFIIPFENNILNLNGIITSENKELDLNLTSKNISISDIQRYFVYYMNRKKPYEKNFSENFYNYKGLGDINLNFKNKKINGSIRLKDFFAISKKFNVPFYWKDSTFYFIDDKVNLKTTGLFADKKLYTDFFAKDIFSKKRISIGTLKSVIDDDFAKKYLPDTKIKGEIDLYVKYIIQHQKPFVEYIASIDTNEDIKYKNSTLDFLNQKRKIKAHTLKDGNYLYLKDLNYFVYEKSVLFINGTFKRKNRNFKPVYFSFKTYRPLDFKMIKFINKNLENGLFKTDIKYFVEEKYFIGNIEILYAKFNDLYINKANILINKYKLKINSAYLSYKKIIIENIFLNSTIQNKIINILNSKADFSNGILTLKGRYNLNNNKGIIYLNSNNINLEGVEFINEQIKGYLNSTSKIYINKNKIENLKGIVYLNKLSFKKLTTKDFFIKNKFLKLLNYVNISKEQLQQDLSDILIILEKENENYFIELYNKNENISLYINGFYTSKDKNNCINTYLRLNNKAFKNKKLLCIPIDWIIKILFKNEYSKILLKNNTDKIPNVSNDTKRILYIKYKNYFDNKLIKFKELK